MPAVRTRGHSQPLLTIYDKPTSTESSSPAPGSPGATEIDPNETLTIPDPTESGSTKQCSTCYGAFIIHDPSSETQYCKPKCEEESRQFFTFLDRAVDTKIDIHDDTLDLPELDTQIVINLLQTAMYLPRYITSRRRIRKMVLKLSLKYSKLPVSLFLKDVTCSVAESHSSGSFADIYSGEYKGLRVALKRLRVFQMIARSKREELKRAFYHESLIWKNLDHCHILPFLGIDDTIFPRSLCMVLPWMGLGNIRDTIDHMRNTLSDCELFVQILIWISDIPSGLDYLHTEGVVHGDLRGANILIDQELHVRLADFGLAVFAEGASREYGSVRGGNARWLAPELIHPELFSLTSERPTYAGDTFAFGCVCVELCTGQTPYFGISDNQVIARVPLGLRPSRPAFGGETPIPDSLWDIIQRCWDQSASKRPSARVLVEATKEFWRPETPQDVPIESSLQPAAQLLLDGDSLSNKPQSPPQVPHGSSVIPPLTINTPDNDGVTDTAPQLHITPGTSMRPVGGIGSTQDGPQNVQQSDHPQWKPSRQLPWALGQNNLSPDHSYFDLSSASNNEYHEQSASETSYELGAVIEQQQSLAAVTYPWSPPQFGPRRTNINSEPEVQSDLDLFNSDSLFGEYDPADYDDPWQSAGTFTNEFTPPYGNNSLSISAAPPMHDNLPPNISGPSSSPLSTLPFDSFWRLNNNFNISSPVKPGPDPSVSLSAGPQLSHRRPGSDNTWDRGRAQASTVYVYPPTLYNQPASPSLLAPPMPSSSELNFSSMPSSLPLRRRRRQPGAAIPSVRVSPYPSLSVTPRRDDGASGTGASVERSRLIEVGVNGAADAGAVPAHAYGTTNPGTSSGTPTFGEVPTMMPNEDTSPSLVSQKTRRRSANFVCPVPGCGSTFARHFNLKGHLRSHAEEKPYQCKWPRCGKGFARQYDLKRHEQHHVRVARRASPAWMPSSVTCDLRAEQSAEG